MKDYKKENLIYWLIIKIKTKLKFINKYKHLKQINNKKKSIIKKWMLKKY